MEEKSLLTLIILIAFFGGWFMVDSFAVKSELKQIKVYLAKIAGEPIDATNK